MQRLVIQLASKLPSLVRCSRLEEGGQQSRIDSCSSPESHESIGVEWDLVKWRHQKELVRISFQGAQNDYFCPW